MQFAYMITSKSQKFYELDTCIIFTIKLKNLRHKENNLLA